MKWTACLLVGVLGVVWPLVPAGAESSEGVVPGVHLAVSGHITKIESGLLFVKMPYGLQLRTISPNKADRVGLHDARVGDTVWLLVDSGNVLLDATRPGGEDFANHKVLAGRIQYADPYWGEIQISTPEGFERFEVDTLAGSKLSVFQEGMPVTIELDADNMMIDIQSNR
ncbi:MAG: hypothetical protein R3B11_06655 [Nitrospira sp.]|jgi:hypothetical protein|nr:hypothetical protein [Nitrospira sp.]MCW5786222.1 hypothetical protein [Nitrospira sp.]MDR4475677.1 hypothetical protein [Nitrospira sp.]HAP39211.1 hypothetical protein [Nitrospira sp.]